MLQMQLSLFYVGEQTKKQKKHDARSKICLSAYHRPIVHTMNHTLKLTVSTIMTGNRSDRSSLHNS